MLCRKRRCCRTCFKGVSQNLLDACKRVEDSKQCSPYSACWMCVSEFWVKIRTYSLHVCVFVCDDCVRAEGFQIKFRCHRSFLLYFNSNGGATVSIFVYAMIVGRIMSLSILSFFWDSLNDRAMTMMEIVKTTSYCYIPANMPKLYTSFRALRVVSFTHLFYSVNMWMCLCVNVSVCVFFFALCADFLSFNTPMILESYAA